MKKTIGILICLTLIMAPLSAYVFAADVTEITSGAYYQLGKYNGSPILWRAVVTDDENGVLMVSDKILCYKIFDPSIDSSGIVGGPLLWDYSAMRIWLNSIADSGEVEWVDEHIPSPDRILRSYITPYSNEKGFLNKDNFSESELSVMKTVSHWQALSTKNAIYTENGLSKPFLPKIVEAENSHLERTVYRYKIEDMDRAYYGAMYRVNDTVMTLDEKQLFNVLSQLGTVASENADGVIPTHPWYTDNDGIYWLRTQYTGNKIICYGSGSITTAIKKQLEEPQLNLRLQ